MNYQPYGYQGAYGGDADPAEEYEDEEEYEIKKQGQLSCWGNQQSMNLNPLVLTNITGSPYFKVQLFNLKVSATICRDRPSIMYICPIYLHLVVTMRNYSFRLITKL